MPAVKIIINTTLFLTVFFPTYATVLCILLLFIYYYYYLLFRFRPSGEFNDPANAGLHVPVDLEEPIHARFTGKVK